METFKGFQIVGRCRKHCRKNTRRDLARELSLFRCCAVFKHLEKASGLWVPGVLQSAVFHSIHARHVRLSELKPCTGDFLRVVVYILSSEESSLSNDVILSAINNKLDK